MSIRLSNGALVLARESRRISQAELATAVDATQGTISKLENGLLASVDEALARRIALKLGYPLEFFTEEIENQPLPAVFYRKKSALKASDEKAVRAQVNISRRTLKRLLEPVDIPEGRVPSIRLSDKQTSATQVAKELRAQWGVPLGPIADVTRLLERAGVVVIPTDFGVELVDGVSVTGQGCPPAIFIRSSLPGDRMRFTLAHELAHIIFHHHEPIPCAESEHEADKFAGEFLAPASDIRPYLTNLTLEKLASLKRHWRLSMACILKRAEDTGRITEWKANQLWRSISKLGYRTAEPVTIPPEKAALFPELIRVHIDDLGYSPEELDRAMVGDLSMFSQQKPTLRAVK